MDEYGNIVGFSSRVIDKDVSQNTSLEQINKFLICRIYYLDIILRKIK